MFVIQRALHTDGSFVHTQILMNVNCTMEDVATIVQILMAVINVLVIVGILLKMTNSIALVG